MCVLQWGVGWGLFARRWYIDAHACFLWWDVLFFLWPFFFFFASGKYVLRSIYIDKYISKYTERHHFFVSLFSLVFVVSGLCCVIRRTVLLLPCTTTTHRVFRSFLCSSSPSRHCSPGNGWPATATDGKKEKLQGWRRSSTRRRVAVRRAVNRAGSEEGGRVEEEEGEGQECVSERVVGEGILCLVEKMCCS